MAVEIEFRPDARAASATSASDPEAWFHHTVLFVPVRFRVDGRDLLPGSGPRDVWAVDSRGVARPSTPGEDDWNSQPLVGFLLGLEGAVRKSSRVGAARCSLAAGNADLTFRLRDDGMLEVTSAANQAPAAAPIDDFLQALALLRRAAQAWLEEAAPHLGKHHAWAEWFPTPETSGHVDREGPDAMARPGDIAEH